MSKCLLQLRKGTVSVVKNVDNSMLMHRRDSKPGGIGEQCVHIVVPVGCRACIRASTSFGIN